MMGQTKIKELISEIKSELDRADMRFFGQQRTTVLEKRGELCEWLDLSGIAHNPDRPEEAKLPK